MLGPCQRAVPVVVLSLPFGVDKRASRWCTANHVWKPSLCAGVFVRLRHYVLTVVHVAVLQGFGFSMSAWLRRWPLGGWESYDSI